MINRTILFFSISSFLLSPFSFAAEVQSSVTVVETTTSTSTKAQTYEELLAAIRAVSKASAEKVEQERVNEAWQTGKLILDHVLQQEERAEYGAKVIERLAADLGMDKRELQYRVEFARTYPIVRSNAQLSWAHYKRLLAIEDDAVRESVAKEAEAQNWPVETLRLEIKNRKLNTVGPDAEEEAPAAVTASAPAAPSVKPGKVSLYQVIEKDGRKYYDLGFATYRRLLGNEPAKFKAGNYVFIKPSGPTYQPVAVKPAPNDLYTYKAKVLNVVDGDTFHAMIELGFGISVQNRLRLRSLDAPELISADGKLAKEALEKVLGVSEPGENTQSSPGQSLAQRGQGLGKDKGIILIKTEKDPDQHGRFIADVWVANKNISEELLKSGVFTSRGNE